MYEYRWKECRFKGLKKDDESRTCADCPLKKCCPYDWKMILDDFFTKVSEEEE